MTNPAELVDADSQACFWVPPCERTMASDNFKVVVGKRRYGEAAGFIRAKGGDGVICDVCELSADELMALAVACMMAVREIRKESS